MARTRSTRSSACAKASMGCGSGGIAKTLASEQAYAMGGQSMKCPTASCPAYTGIIVFLLVLYIMWCAVMWSTKPAFARKPGANPADPNSPDITSSALYSLLWAALVLMAVALIVRCRSCK